jgi:hypothetical protein
VSPFAPREGSDLIIAQPLTFESMWQAKAFASIVDPNIRIRQTAVVAPEDRHTVPEGYTLDGTLERSVLDLASFRQPRPVPLIWDILSAACTAAEDAGDNEWIVYTNTDITLMPQFYTAVATMLRGGAGALIVNRRTIGAATGQAMNLAMLAAEIGDPHPGYDCFVFRPSDFRRFVEFHSCLGLGGFVMRPLLFNMGAFCDGLRLIDDAHLTYHLGGDGIGLDERFADYLAHNKAQAMHVLDTVCRDDAMRGRMMRFLELVDEGWIPAGYFGQEDWRLVRKRERRKIRSRIERFAGRLGRGARTPGA